MIITHFADLKKLYKKFCPSILSKEIRRSEEIANQYITAPF